jgi:hypothetical protein
MFLGDVKAVNTISLFALFLHIDLIPDSCDKEFRAVAGRANFFFTTKFAKPIIWRLRVEKILLKKKTRFQWLFLRKDRQKLKLNRYAPKIFQLFYDITGVKQFL